MLNQFEVQYKEMLDHILKVTTKAVLSSSRLRAWALDDKHELKKLELIEIVKMYVILMHWKAWEQNTFYRQYDTNGCPIWVYPSQLKETDLMFPCVNQKKSCDCCKEVEHGGGLIKLLHCCHINIAPALEAAGLLPLDRSPDGIDFMYIEQTPPCDPRLFIPGRPRI